MLNCVFPWITVGDLYNHLFDAVVVSSSLPSTPGHGREGYYFGANEEHTLYQVGKSISDVMLKMHKSNGGEPTTFTQEEINKYFNVSPDFNPSFISSMLTKFNNLSSGLKLPGQQLALSTQSLQSPWVGAEEDYTRYAG